MLEDSHVHVVDPDGGRRAKLARELYARSIHAEIYESIDELVSCAPTDGTLLVADADDQDSRVSLETIRSLRSYLPVAFFSSNPKPEKIVRAMLSGALDYLEWPCSPETLHASVDRLRRQGESFARIERRKAEAERLVATLTPRERDVLQGVLEGESNKGIAHKLGISPRTVEIHRSNMLTRLNAQSSADAVRIALYGGLGDEPIID
jgi:two-component system, LuxR family, response regulator FixJ